MREGSWIEITFVGKSKMASLNKKYRKRKGAVPILSFPQNGQEGPLGDIVICTPLARKIGEEKGKKIIDVIGELTKYGIKKLLAD